MPHIGELASLLSSAPPILAVTPGASPYTFTAPDPGRMILTGGTVSLVEIGRQGAFLSTGLTAGLFPLSRGDALRVTYSVAPTMNFLKG
jgi:hypothetical protein